MLFFRGGAFCCYWRQIGIPDKCENVSKLRREAGGSSRGKFGLLGHHYGYCARARVFVCHPHCTIFLLMQCQVSK